MKKRIKKLNKEEAYIIVEATLIFPMIIIIFFGMIMASMVLPFRASLQKATQYAANSIAMASSDSWFGIDAYNNLKKSKPRNIYLDLISPFEDIEEGALTQSVKEQVNWLNMNLDETAFANKDVKVDYKLTKYILYNEVSVTATKHIRFPINIAWMGMTNEIDISVTSTAVVNNGDEFIRGMDLATDIVMKFDEKTGGHLKGLSDKLDEKLNRFAQFMNW